MGLILHDWNLENKMYLVKAAYDALPDGGAFIVIENLIDDARRENAFGMLMSLNMLIEFGDAFDYTGVDFAGWCKEVGFKETEVLPLAGPTSAGIAHKWLDEILPECWRASNCSPSSRWMSFWSRSG